MMNNTSQCSLCLSFRLLVKIIRDKAHLMNAVATTTLEHTVSFLDDAPFHLFTLHREHCLSIDNGCALPGQPGVRSTSYDASLPFAFQVAANDLGCRFITLNSGIRFRVPLKSKLSRNAHARCELHNVIGFSDSQPIQHTAGKLHSPRSQYALTQTRQDPMTRHLLY